MISQEKLYNLMSRANAAADRQDYNTQKNILQEIIDLGFQNAQIFINKSDCESRLGNIKQAILDVTKAIQLKPSDEMAYYNRGAILYDQENYVEALRDFDKAISLRPSYHEAYNYRGLIKQKQRMYADALKDFETSIKLGNTRALKNFQRLKDQL